MTDFEVDIGSPDDTFILRCIDAKTMNPAYVVMDYLDTHLRRSGLETISNRTIRLFRTVGKLQEHRAARYQRKAYSRSFRGRG
jgi:hypothetical protein